MHKRSLLVGFGLGLLVAGLVSMFLFNGRWYAGPGAVQQNTAESTSGNSGAVSPNANSYGPAYGYYGPGWYGPHWGFWGFLAFPFFFVLRCLLPLLIIGFIFSLFRRLMWRRRWGHRWGYRRGYWDYPTQPPTV